VNGQTTACANAAICDIPDGGAAGKCLAAAPEGARCDETVGPGCRSRGASSAPRSTPAPAHASRPRPPPACRPARPRSPARGVHVMTARRDRTRRSARRFVARRTEPSARAPTIVALSGATSPGGRRPTP
jgi:hypothetical protein